MSFPSDNPKWDIPGEKQQIRGLRGKAPQLRPEECTQRAAQIAVDMCVMNTQYMLTLDQFISKGEMFHLQMHLLYGLIDTMSATADINQETVLDMCRKYFETLKRERNKQLGP